MSIPSLRPLRPRDFDFWKAMHLLNRAGFGGTPSQAQALVSLGLDAAVDYVVDFGRLPAPDLADAVEFDKDIMRPPTADERAEARRARQANDEVALERIQAERNRRTSLDRRQMAAMQRWWLRRMIETGRPLEEKMTLFWHGHFATGFRTVEDSWHMFLQNALFRQHAVGSFRALCHGIIRDPAMLRYLDNHLNRRQAPNENLARELMELFILGEGNDYTEQDIKEAARALTGYTFDDDDFAFNRQQHDTGSKRILGRTGNFDGDDLVSILLSRPVASEFICFKLYRFFVNDLPGTPPRETQQFITRLARNFREGDYELRPLLRTLFRSEHFYHPDNAASLIKSPTQLVVQALRTLRTPARDLTALVSALDLMGQNLFQPPNVKGWTGGRSWINTSTMFVRQNILVYLLTGRRPGSYPWQEDGSVYDPTFLLDHLEGTLGTASTTDAITYLLRLNLGTEPHGSRVDEVVSFVDQHGGRLDRDRLVATLSLVTAMPEYQLC